jgi:hypothetical protein
LQGARFGSKSVNVSVFRSYSARGPELANARTAQLVQIGARLALHSSCNQFHKMHQKFGRVAEAQHALQKAAVSASGATIPEGLHRAGPGHELIE